MMVHLDEVGAMCEALPLLRRLASAEGRTSEVEEIVGRMSGGDGDHDRDVLELREVARVLGVPGLGPRSVLKVPGASPGAPVDGLYVCPATRCDRSWVRAPGMAPPDCHIFGHPLAPVAERTTGRTTT